MKIRQFSRVLAAGLGLCLASSLPAMAGESADAVQAEVVRALVAEALAEAESAESGPPLALTAGHDGRSFFLASADNAYRLHIGGQVQLRYIANFREGPTAGFGSTTGFQHRRARLLFSGHVVDPRLTFRIQPDIRRQDGRLGVIDLNVSYRPTDELTLTGGRMRVPFAKEDMHSSGRQLAVERSLVNAIFAGGHSTGVAAAYQRGDLRTYAMVSNGFSTNLHDFTPDIDANAARLALTARAEFKLAGDWSQYDQFAGYRNDPTGLILGTAAHWEHRRTPLGGRWDQTVDFFTWAADASFYMENVALHGAFFGRHATRAAGDAATFDDYGLLAQAGYTVHDKLQPFARWEWLMPDNARDQHDVHLLTAGLNYFIAGHNVKLTTDVVWALNSLSGFAGGAGGLGLLPDHPDERNQVVWRTQFQLLF